mgnify:CR=1 FL=1
MPTDPATFLKRLEASGLLTDSIVAAWPRLTGLQSAEAVADELVRDTLLTEFQSEVLLGDGSIPLVIGDYVVQGMIGQGGMGVVLKARHQRMRRTVAIKFLLKSLAPSKSIEKRFEREVEAAAQLDHPHIVTAYDAGVHTDGSYYLVMQYIEGQDLSSLVKKSGPLPVPLAIHAIVQAAEGLAYAHEHGIVHRDVKPGNLLLDHVGVVRVLDMGLARIQATPGAAIDDGGHADLTNTGSVMGTVDYMAPEQALDARTADQRSDIYGLGCTLYYLLTGNPPYLRDTIMQRLLAHREDEIPRLRVVRPQIPQELDELLAQMLAKNPADRHVSMRQLIVDIGRLNITVSAPDIMETLEQPLSDPEGSSIVFASADEDSNSDESARPSGSGQPGVAIKPKPAARRRRRRGQPDIEHPVTEEFQTADTALREKEQRQLREGSQRRPARKRRKKSAKHKRGENPSKHAQPVLPRAQAPDENLNTEPKPRRSLKPVLLWLFASSWGVPRVYFAGLAAIACLILMASLRPDPNGNSAAGPGPTTDTRQPGPATASPTPGDDPKLANGSAVAPRAELVDDLIQQPGGQTKPVSSGTVKGDGLELRPVRELNSSGMDGYCWLNPSGLTIYFTREGIPKSGIWKASRITIAHQFGVPVFETRARQIALSGDETVAVALMGYEKPSELAESSRRGFRQAPLDNFRAIVRFAGSRSVQSPWLLSNGLTLIFQRTDEQNSYPGGSSPRSSRTEFVISKRAGLEAAWSFPGRLPFGTAPQLSKPLTWPMLTDDGLTLLFSHGAGPDSEVMIATRPSDDARFRNVRTVNIDGKPLVGRAPRYVESTGELFVTQLHASSTTDWDLFVIRNFEIDKYR